MTIQAAYLGEENNIIAMEMLPQVIKKGMRKLNEEFERMTWAPGHTARNVVTYLERFRVAIIRSSEERSQAFKWISGVKKAVRSFNLHTLTLSLDPRINCQAYAAGYTELTKILFQQPYASYSNGDDNFTPFHAAIIEDRIEELPWLIENQAPIDAKENQRGRTALHVACLLGKKKFIRALLDAGADINRRDNRGFTPLHLACIKSELKYLRKDRAWLAIRLFVEGADPSATDLLGNMPKKYLANANLKNNVTRYPIRERMPHLSRDTWIYIFKFLPQKELFNNVQPVCTAFHHYATNALVESYFAVATHAN